MSYTKRKIVQSALTELGLGNYAFDLSVDQLDEALTRLSTMMAEWKGRGIDLGYTFADDNEANDEVGIPDWSRDAVITNLAIRLAPAYGKSLNMATLTTARQTWNTVLTRTTKHPQRRLSEFLSGAGSKSSTPFTGPVYSDTIENPETSVDFQ